jgi:hypothetical protein
VYGQVAKRMILFQEKKKDGKKAIVFFGCFSLPTNFLEKGLPTRNLS